MPASLGHWSQHAIALAFMGREFEPLRGHTFDRSAPEAVWLGVEMPSMAANDPFSGPSAA